jgi:hypothetical protein
MGLTKASVHDVQYLSEIKNSGLSTCTLIADKGYLSSTYQLDLFNSCQVNLQTPKRANQERKNMMALLLAVFYFVAVILDQTQKLTVMAGHVLNCAKRVFGIPDFKYYALGDGLSNIFSRYPGKLMKYP